ncbi:molybdate transport system substrate-binding protein [Actinopolyspora xinjiangensis]|uniref:Molybdate transport system substrate-binding protein n=1 Tax=Actinopolyspora xinjiangensis TaxID=405564 RepID=A0A1H0P477_9ACTN|nr:molybdate ABC transporter substrate-binding protein [Actinopolyspora xinjiangensis]SDO99763.1 molybdate transport system substrate-binding protein [Actinopolyspora xinjiangensis]
MNHARRGGGAVAVLTVLLSLVTGCGAGGSGQRTLTVLAAASLTESFRAIGDEFSRNNPGIDVRFNFQGSSLLAEQIRQGSGGDVFASANEEMMTKVRRADALAGQPRPFATNRLTVVVPPDNPAGVESFADLADPDTSVVVCAPRVPCGSATERVESASGVELSPVSEENDVKDVLHKVVAGEADAGLVYVTDAESAGDEVEVVDFPAADEVTNEYPIAELAASEHPELAERFVEFVRGERGREILDEYGFGAP